MNSVTTWALTGFGILAGWGTYRYIKKRINQYVLEKIAEKIDCVVETAGQEEFFKPVHGNSAVVTFTSGGKRHQIFFPYNRKKSTRCLGQTVYLVKSDGENVDITQKPGVSYTVSAKDLGGEYIIIKNREGETVKRFSREEIPHLF